MVTKLDVARWLSSGSGGGNSISRYAKAGGVSGSPSSGTTMRYGYAMADSIDGWVTVKLDTSEESIACVCDSPIKQGQRVQVWSQNGQLKAQVIGQNIVDESVKDSVVDVGYEYAAGEDDENPPSEGWSESYPTTADYVWQRQKTTKGDGTVTYSTPVCISKPPDGYDRDATYYATSSTGTSTSAKVATVQSGGSFSLKEGATVSVKFTYGNTVSNPTLNVGGTGERPIYTLGTPYAYWAAGASVLFVYDGSAWQVASVPVYASTTTVGNPAAQNVYIDGQGVAMRNGTTEYSTYGPDDIHLGLNASTDANIYLFNDTMRMRADTGDSLSGQASLAIEPVPGKTAGGMRFAMSDLSYLQIYESSAAGAAFSGVVLSGDSQVRVTANDGDLNLAGYHTAVEARFFDLGQVAALRKPCITIGSQETATATSSTNRVFPASTEYGGYHSSSDVVYMYQSGNYIYVRLKSGYSGSAYVEVSGYALIRSVSSSNAAVDIMCESVSGPGNPSVELVGGGLQTTNGVCHVTLSVSPVVVELPFSVSYVNTYRIYMMGRVTNATGDIFSVRLTAKVI